jgi:hypothetical protein
MKRFLITLALTCALSAQVLAGEIPSGGSPSPAPSGTTQTTLLGDIQNGGQIYSAALTLIQTVVGLLM